MNKAGQFPSSPTDPSLSACEGQTKTKTCKKEWSRGMTEAGQSEREAPLHGDVLEKIVSHVRPLDLIPASYVSKAWCGAVSSSLRRSSRLIPWLILHIQSRRNPSKPVLTYAYDPHSSGWILIPCQRNKTTLDVVSSSHPGLLHSLNLSNLAFSADAFGSAWRVLGAPRVWRTDAVVARVGSHLVVAGGACDFEDDPCAVESCTVGNDGTTAGRWEACESMPEVFEERAANMWLSVAVSDRKMYVLDKSAGWFCSFDPDTKRWGPTHYLRPDPAVFVSAIGISGDRLILVGAVGDATHVESLKLWVVDPETLQNKEMGEMPPEMVERLVGNGWGLRHRLWSIGFSNVGDYGYIYNPSEPKEMFLCEFGKGCSRKWDCIGCPASTVDQIPTHNVAFGCSTVGIDDLRKLRLPRAS